MANKTANLGLTKPTPEEFYDVGVQNANMDKIDEQIGQLKEQAGQIPSHKHTKSEITDFPTSMTPTAHTHKKSEITDFPTSMTPTAHNHSASEITSGTLPIARGGTGATSVEGVLQNLGLSKAITAIEVDTSLTAPSYALDPSNTNVEKRYLASNGLTSITLTKGSFSNNTEYHVTVIFKSGTTATTITNTAGVYFTGDDCDGGVFTPVASKVYEVGIWWNGFSLQGVVRGV